MNLAWRPGQQAPALECCDTRETRLPAAPQAISPSRSRSRRRRGRTGCRGGRAGTPAGWAGSPPARPPSATTVSQYWQLARCAADLVQQLYAPAQDRQGVRGGGVLAGPVAVQHPVLQHEPAPLPLARPRLPGAQVAAHLPSLPRRRHLQPLRDEPADRAAALPPLEPGPQLDILPVHCTTNIQLDANS